MTVIGLVCWAADVIGNLASFDEECVDPDAGLKELQRIRELRAAKAGGVKSSRASMVGTKGDTGLHAAICETLCGT